MAIQPNHLFSFLFTISALSSSCYGGRNLQLLSNITHAESLSEVNTYSVNDYGAKGDGKTDDTQAFVKAWDEACSSSNAIFLVPRGKTYLLKPITFKGPCKSSLTIKFVGNILASNVRSDYKDNARQWLVIKYVDHLSVEGGGSIDGNGKIWWENSCKINKKNPCKHAPTALVFKNCNNLVVSNLRIQNAQQMHLSFSQCNHVSASGISISSPEKSPNTDGIHITHSQNIKVTNANIGTGDDCISIEDGTQIVRATDITCGPGHGISLGDNNSKVHVSDIIVDGATLSGTTNGIRIKTWQGGSGSATNMKFLNIKLDDVDNPIIIDQNYCDQAKPCKKQKSAVQVKNVVYKNIKGTSSSKSAVVFDCNAKYPCKGIIMENIDIKKTNGKVAGATCDNVQLSKVVDVSPQC
ncbi:Polygalacturonase [Bienertia sinuspersici]